MKLSSLMPPKIYLIVPYSDLDIIKSAKGRFDPNEILWYIYKNNNCYDNIIERYEVVNIEDKELINVDYSFLHTIRSLGAVYHRPLKQFAIYKTQKNYKEMLSYHNKKPIKFQKDDIKFGLESEKKVLKTLKSYHNKIVPHKKYNKYSTIDFEIITTKSKIYFELKTRKVTKNNYPSIMITKNKYDFLIKEKRDNNIRGIFLFKFTDGLYYVEVSDLIEGVNYNVKGHQRLYRADVNDKLKDTLYIDHCIVKPIEDIKLRSKYFN